MRAAGFAGRILIITSQGGVMDAADVAAAPVHLINSGPSMAPFGAMAYTPAGADATLIVGDAGGTTFDVSLVRRGRIPRTRETWLGRPLREPHDGHALGRYEKHRRRRRLDRLDRRGRPLACRTDQRRSRARPGRLWPGRFAPDRHGRGACTRLSSIRHIFLGGRMPLDRKAAEAAIATRDRRSDRAERSRKPLPSILELASEHMVQAILDVTLNQGIDPASAAFVAGGGAAGLNCVAIGRRLGCRHRLCA